LIDMPFSAPFYKLLQGKPLTLQDLRAVKPELGQTLMEFADLCIERRKILANNSLSEAEKKTQVAALRYQKGRIEDLDITFSLPDGELKLGGDEIFVNSCNLEEYVDLAANLYLSTGIRKQMHALRKGFNQLFPSSRLKLFSVLELEENLCGTPENLENWTREDILENAKFSNGFSANSKAVGFLVNVLTSFTPEQRRSFLQFLTGSPRLPIGGWKSLQPKFTVQLKTLEFPDHFLPSVNTCFLFLKLPDYSSQDVLRERLLYAMNNGQTAQFDFD
jgi:E3 ubiquitin-protein ligase TRIP12